MQERNKSYLEKAYAVCQLRLATQLLLMECAISQNQLHREIIAKLDDNLSLLFKGIIKYDFLNRVSKGPSLFVGEGNLSFAYDIATNIKFVASNITATVLETKLELSDATLNNAFSLKKLGAVVVFGVDATKISETVGKNKFDTIIFQFPNVGSREPIEGHNPNFILVRDFLLSAIKHLTKDGVVIISAVDNDYYNGIFKFNELADLIGFKPPNKYRFNPDDFLYYEHTMTYQEGSALDNYDKFTTWEFRL